MRSIDSTDDKLFALNQGYLKNILSKNAERSNIINPIISVLAKRKIRPSISIGKIGKENDAQNPNTMSSDLSTISGNKRREFSNDNILASSNNIYHNDTTMYFTEHCFLH